MKRKFLLLAIVLVALLIPTAVFADVTHVFMDMNLGLGASTYSGNYTGWDNYVNPFGNWTSFPSLNWIFF
jgi:opacity protein-like surface antigen